MNNAFYERLSNVTKEKEMQKQQAQDKETESENENILEQETMKLEYQDLDVVLREETKQLSITMKNHVVTLSILEQANKDIVGENTQIKEYISKLKAKDKQLNESIQQSANEIGNIYQTVHHHGKILEQLKEFVKMIRGVKDMVQLRTNEFNESVKKLENDINVWKSTTSTKLSDLRNKIEAKKRSIAAMDNDDHMTNKKIGEFHEKRARLEDRYKECLRILEQRKEIVKNLRARNDEILEKSELLKVEISNLEDPSEHLLRAKEKKVTAEENKQLLRNKLETMRIEYNAKVEEKSNLLTKKYNLDKNQIERDFKLRSSQVLDESIEIQNRKINELDQKTAALAQDDTLEKMEKEKAYLEASRSYLEQKYNNIKIEDDSLSSKVESLRKDSTRTKEKIAEKETQLSKIRTAIETRKVEDQNTARQNPGILKQTQGPKSPVSPKKVTFTGVPSSDSSTDANASQTTQVQGTAFDQMLAEFRFSRQQ
ncbi:unnamed protein product [Callosobruchus maculatus]|nr:unnamed protein product [Callosobruchus maculatus]